MNTDGVKNRSKSSAGDGVSGSPGAGNLLGLFDPPPSSAQPARSETDPLIPLSPARNDASSTIAPAHEQAGIEKLRVPSGIGGGFAEPRDAEDLTSTVRRINHRAGEYDTIDHGKTTSLTGLFRNEITPSANRLPSGENVDTGREMFQKTVAATAVTSARAQKPNNSPVSGSVTATIRSVLTPFLLPSTWMGGILFVLYHVVFCMANGGSITRPYSGFSTSLLGDMARYTTVGIIASCPYLVYALSDKRGFTGIPSLYPSADLFLAVFLAEAGAIIDKTIVDDWKSGVIVFEANDNSHTYSSGELELEHERLLTELWFGSFALVVAFGMFTAGSLLILASKIKLANLGTYLPYGVLCGFFSAVGILMWKLAITIDAPTSFPTDGEWTILLLHHLPSLMVGIAMNVLGPKHPFFVTGLILMTIVGFYGTMMVLDISLEEAQAGGWFYSHNELQSSSSVLSTSLSSPNEGGSEDSWWHEMLPPRPFGTWFALFGQRVHPRAVVEGAEHMLALAILYLLRASIHAAALKKSVNNLRRRVPMRTTTKTEATEEANDTTCTRDVEIQGGGSSAASSPKGRHRRDFSTDSVLSTLYMASNAAQYVRDEVRIVNLSLADGQNLRGKCYSQPHPPRNHFNRMTSIGSTDTSSVRNITDNVYNMNIHEQIGGRLTDRVSPPRVLNAPDLSRSSLISGKDIGNHNQDDSDTDALLLPTLSREVSGLNHRTPSISLKSPRNAHGTAAEKKPLLDRDTSVRSSGIGTNNPSTMDYMEIRPPPTDLTLEDIFVQYGYGMFVTAFCGGFGCVPQVATSNIMYAIGADKPAPQYFSVFLLLVAFYSSGFELVRFIPKAAFSSLLVLGATDNIIIWFLRPISKMDNLLEWSVVPFIAGFSLLVGMLNAIVLGIGLSTFLFVTDFFRVGVVKYEATGIEIRSRIERSLVESVWLDANGDTLRVLVLQNYLFFGNASSVLGYIETMFEEISVNESDRFAYPIPPVPVVLVLDLSLITGMDTSAVDAFMDIWRICKTNDCKLYLCGLSPRLKKTFGRGGMKPDTKGARKSRTLLYFSDLDHGLGRAEDVLIDKDMGDFANQSLFQLKKGTSGFHVALQHIDQLHITNMAEGLLALEPFTRIVTLEPGQILYEKDGGLIKEKDHGLFFVEFGMIREEDSRSDRTNTRTAGSLRRNSISARGNDNTLRGKHARLDAAAQRAGLTSLAGGKASNRSVSHHSNNLRIATAGPGW